MELTLTIKGSLADDIMVMTQDRKGTVDEASLIETLTAGLTALRERTAIHPQKDFARWFQYHGRNPRAQLESIERIVCEYYHTPYPLPRVSRRQPIAWQRQVCMAMAYWQCPLCTTELIGQHFDKDHGNIIHAARAVSAAVDTDSVLRGEVLDIEARWSKLTGLERLPRQMRRRTAA